MPIEIGISTTIGGIAGNTPGGGTPPFTNTKSILLDGIDDFCETANQLVCMRGIGFFLQWFFG